jgi:class 3 adenylate cyclase
MSSVQEPHLHLEVGHILFLDIVGYSKLLVDEQKELVQELNQIVRETEQFRTAEADGKLTRLPTGDGMVLVFTNNPEAPVECALEISKALQSHPKLKVRMGIHSGPVNPFADVNDQSNLLGAGINMAQRVMYCGDAGHGCALAVVGEEGRALDALERAIGAGLAGGDWIPQDPDWERLRDHPRFQALVQRLAR